VWRTFPRLHLVSQPETGNSLVAHPFLSKSSGCSGISGTSSLSSVSRHLHDWPTSCVGCLIDACGDSENSHSQTCDIPAELRPHLDPFGACVPVRMSQAHAPLSKRWQSRSAARRLGYGRASFPADFERWQSRCVNGKAASGQLQSMAAVLYNSSSKRIDSGRTVRYFGEGLVALFLSCSKD